MPYFFLFEAFKNAQDLVLNPFRAFQLTKLIFDDFQLKVDMLVAGGMVDGLVGFGTIKPSMNPFHFLLGDTILDT